MRNTYALVNLKYLKENIEEIKSYYNGYKYYIGVIKGNGYGHGNRIASTLEMAGINYLACATIEEAIDIRKYTSLPILCFGYVDILDIDYAINNNVTLSIISYDYYKELRKINKNIKVHLKLNTGMNRFGIKDKKQVKEIFDDIKNTNMELEGIYTHLATSGITDVYYDKQISNFKELTSLIDLNSIKMVHLFNSMAVARHKKLDFDNTVRLGLMMYGFTYNIPGSTIGNLKRKIKLIGKNISATTLTNNLKLKKVLSLYSEVVNINEVYPNEFVGYNAKYKVHNNEKIAVVCIGHADGVTSNYKKVVINNKFYDIVGYSMDYIMVKVDSSVKLHDTVTLIGDGITVGSIAGSDSPQHILVSISSRVYRKYEE